MTNIYRRNSPVLASALFFAGLVLCLLEIWLPSYYVTGDGPCHLYNATMLRDRWLGHNQAFYAPFFEANTYPNPNWFGHILLAVLLLVFNPAVAEKLELTAYILIFAAGYYKLVKEVHGKSAGYLLLLILPLIINHTFEKGFYNFTISIGFCMWVLWAWVHYLKRKNAGNLLLLVMLVALSFFSHPLGFVYGGVGCFGVLITYGYHERSGNAGGTGKAFLRNMIALAGAFIPFVVMLFWFSTSKLQQNNLTPGFYGGRLMELYQFRYLVTHVSNERPYALAVGISILLLLIASVIYKYRRREGIKPYDGLLLLPVFGLVIYTCFHDFFLGVGLLEMRSQILFFVAAVCCIAVYRLPARLERIAGIIFFILFVGINAVRLPAIFISAEGVTDLVSTSKYIPSRSVILRFCLTPNGRRANGTMITDANWIFGHAGEYLAAVKPTISLQNYEANDTYFPFKWKPEANPYNHLSKEEGIEGTPPFVDISNYERVSGHKIDYILFSYFDSSFIGRPHFDALLRRIDSQYHLVYKPAPGKVILYERNAH